MARASAEERLARVAGYLYCFTGVQPSAEEVEEFTRFARSFEESRSDRPVS